MSIWPELRGLRALVAGVPAIWAGAAAALSCASGPDFTTHDPALAALLARTADVVAAYPSLARGFGPDGPELCLSADVAEAHGYYTPGNDRVVISADLPEALQVGILIHELRHVDQATRGVCPTADLAMRNYARAIWAIEADATTVSLIVARDLADRGDPSVWEALASWPGTAPIAAAYASALDSTGDTGTAAEAAFAAWYAVDDLREAYYVAGCSQYLDTADRTHRLPSYADLSPDYFTDLCVLPDGTAFDCAEPEGLRR